MPKLAQRSLDVADAPDARRSPRGREQPAITRLVEPGVNQQHDTPVGLGPDHATSGLEDAVHAGKRVGVVEPSAGFFLEIVADQVALDAELGQANPNDDGADQAST